MLLMRAFGHDRIVLRDEFSLHREIVARLQRASVPFEREVQMGAKKRPDFMLGSVVVEVKIQGSAMGILRQLKRYADDPRVEGVVLVSTRPITLPSLLGGKSVLAVDLWQNLL